LFEVALSKFIDNISIPDCTAMISPLALRTQENPEVLTFQWPISAENEEGRIAHAGRGRNCMHAQCFVYPNFILIISQDLKCLLKSANTSLIRCPVCSANIPFSDIIIDGFFTSLVKKYNDQPGCFIEVDGIDCALSEEQTKELSTFTISSTGHCVLKVSGTRLNASLSQRLS
jgi:hypothetical protein